MRLIDADSLKKGICSECSLNGDKCLREKCDWDSIYHIDHAKTINAVPVGFILKYLEHIKENERWNDVSNIKRLGIREMLEKWKEENESNISN